LRCSFKAAITGRWSRPRRRLLRYQTAAPPKPTNAMNATAPDTLLDGAVATASWRGGASQSRRSAVGAPAEVDGEGSASTDGACPVATLAVAGASPPSDGAADRESWSLELEAAPGRVEPVVGSWPDRPGLAC